MPIDHTRYRQFMDAVAALRRPSGPEDLDAWHRRLALSLDDLAAVEAAQVQAAPIDTLRPAAAGLPLPATRGVNGDVAALAHSIRSGAQRAVDVARSALQAAGAWHSLNAFTTLVESEVLRQAEAIDAAVARRVDPGPLAGVPVAVKDLMPVRGHPVSNGTLARAPVHADRDAAVVARLRAAGAVIFGMTNLHELAYGVTSHNPHFGAVGNPRFPGVVPGGSSGGSAAAVAAGIVPLAVGTDTGGSVRIPAACCGIVGFKPTFGAVDKTDVHPLAWSLDHVGPMAASVDDAALMFRVMAALNEAPTGPEVPVPALAFATGFFRELVQPAVLARVDEVRARALGRGATVTEVDVVDMHLAPGAQFLTQGAEATQANWDIFAEVGDRLGEDVRVRLAVGQFLLATDYVKAQRVRRHLRDACVRAIGEADVLVTPTLPCVPPPVGQSMLTVEGRTFPTPALLTRLTSPFNLTGLPALAIPCGSDAEGLPVSLQLVGRPGEDGRVLAAGCWIEQLLAGSAA
jgi:aspartyl-tRNA(Asn)/glutamyl-tRNA(Gln) amidotransferase subunit A